MNRANIRVSPGGVFQSWPQECQKWLRTNLTWSEMQVFLWDESQAFPLEFSDDRKGHAPPRALTLIPAFHCPVVDLSSNGSDPLTDSYTVGGDKLLKLIASEFAKNVLLKRNELEAIKNYEREYRIYKTNSEKILRRHALARSIEEQNMKYTTPSSSHSSNVISGIFGGLSQRKNEEAFSVSDLKQTSKGANIIKDPSLALPMPPNNTVYYDDADTGELTRIVANLKTTANWSEFLRSTSLDSVGILERVIFCVAERTAYWRAELWLKWFLRTNYPFLYGPAVENLNLHTNDNDEQAFKIAPLNLSPYNFSLEGVPELEIYLSELKKQTTSQSGDRAADVFYGQNDNTDSSNRQRIGGGGVATAGRLFLEPFKAIYKLSVPILDLSRTISSIMPSVGFSDESLLRLELLLGEIQRYGVWLGDEPPESLPSGGPYYYDPFPKKDNTAASQDHSFIGIEAENIVSDNYTLGGSWMLRDGVEVLKNANDLREITEHEHRVSTSPSGVLNLCSANRHFERVCDTIGLPFEACESLKKIAASFYITSAPSANKASEESEVHFPSVYLHDSTTIRDRQRFLETRWHNVGGGPLAYVPLKIRQKAPLIVSGGEGCGVHFPAFLKITSPTPSSSRESPNGSPRRSYSNAKSGVLQASASSPQVEVISEYAKILSVDPQPQQMVMNNFLFSPEYLFTHWNVSDSPMKKIVRESFVFYSSFFVSSEAAQQVLREFERSAGKLHFDGEATSPLPFDQNEDPKQSRSPMECTIRSFSFFEQFMDNGVSAKARKRVNDENELPQNINNANANMGDWVARSCESDEEEQKSEPQLNEISFVTGGAKRELPTSSVFNEKIDINADTRRGFISLHDTVCACLSLEWTDSFAYSQGFESFRTWVNSGGFEDTSREVTGDLPSMTLSSTIEKVNYVERFLGSSRFSNKQDPQEEPNSVLPQKSEEVSENSQRVISRSLRSLAEALSRALISASRIRHQLNSRLKRNYKGESVDVDTSAFGSEPLMLHNPKYNFKSESELKKEIFENFLARLEATFQARKDSAEASGGHYVVSSSSLQVLYKELVSPIIGSLCRAIGQSLMISIRDAHNAAVTQAICISGRKLRQLLLTYRALPANITNPFCKVSALNNATSSHRGATGKSPVSRYGQGYNQLSTLTSTQQQSYFGFIFNNLKDLLRLRHRCMKLSSSDIRKYEISMKSSGSSKVGMGSPSSSNSAALVKYRPPSLEQYDHLINRVIRSDGWVPLDTVLDFVNLLLAKGSHAFDLLFSSINDDGDSGGSKIEGFATNDPTPSNKKKKKKGSNENDDANQSSFSQIEPVSRKFLEKLLVEHDLLQRYELGFCRGQSLSYDHTATNTAVSNGTFSTDKTRPFDGTLCVRSIYAHEDTPAQLEAIMPNALLPKSRKGLFFTIFEQRPRIFPSFEEEQSYLKLENSPASATAEKHLVIKDQEQQNFRRHWYTVNKIDPSSSVDSRSPLPHLKSVEAFLSSLKTSSNPLVPQIQTTRAFSQPAPPRTAFYIVSKPGDVDKNIKDLTNDLNAGLKLYDRTAFITLLAPEAIFRDKDFYFSQFQALAALDEKESKKIDLSSETDEFGDDYMYDSEDSDCSFDEYDDSPLGSADGLVSDTHFQPTRKNLGTRREVREKMDLARKYEASTLLLGNENRPFGETFTVQDASVDYSCRPTFVPTETSRQSYEMVVTGLGNANLRTLQQRCQGFGPETRRKRRLRGIKGHASGESPVRSSSSVLTGYVSDYIATNLTNPDGQCDEKLKGQSSLRLFEVDLYALVKDKNMIVRQLPDRDTGIPLGSSSPMASSKSRLTPTQSQKTLTPRTRTPTSPSNFNGGSDNILIEGHYLALPTEHYADKSGRWFPADFFTGRVIEISQGISSVAQQAPRNTSSTSAELNIVPAASSISDRKEVKVEFLPTNYMPFYFADDSIDNGVGDNENSRNSGGALVPLRKFSKHQSKTTWTHKKYVFGHRMLRRDEVSLSSHIIESRCAISSKGASTNEESALVSPSSVINTITFSFCLNLENYLSLIDNFTKDEARTQLWVLLPKRVLVKKHSALDTSTAASETEEESVQLRSWCTTMESAYFKKLKYIKRELKALQQKGYSIELSQTVDLPSSDVSDADDDALLVHDGQTLQQRQHQLQIKIPREFEPCIPLDVVTPETVAFYRPVGTVSPLTVQVGSSIPKQSEGAPHQGEGGIYVTYTLGSGSGGNLLHRTADLKTIKSEVNRRGLRYQEISYKPPQTANLKGTDASTSGPKEALAGTRITTDVKQDILNNKALTSSANQVPFLTPKELHEWYTVVLVTKKINFSNDSVVKKITKGVLGEEACTDASTDVDTNDPPLSASSPRHRFTVKNLSQFRKAIIRQTNALSEPLSRHDADQNSPANGKKVITSNTVTQPSLNGTPKLIARSDNYELLEFTGDTLLDYVTVRDAISLAYSRLRVEGSVGPSKKQIISPNSASNANTSESEMLVDFRRRITQSFAQVDVSRLLETGNIASDVCNNDVLACVLPFELKRQIAIEEYGGIIESAQFVLNDDSDYSNPFSFESTLDPYSALLLHALNFSTSVKDRVGAGYTDTQGIAMQIQDAFDHLSPSCRTIFETSFSELAKIAASTGINIKTKADMLEALFGAVYEDGHGIDGIRKMCFLIFGQLAKLEMYSNLISSALPLHSKDESGDMYEKLVRAQRGSPHSMLISLLQKAVLEPTASAAADFILGTNPNGRRKSVENGPFASPSLKAVENSTVGRVEGTNSAGADLGLSALSDLAPYCFSPFDCHTLLEIDAQELTDLATMLLSIETEDPLEEQNETSKEEEDEAEALRRKDREAWLRQQDISDAEKDALDKTSGGIIYYITDNSHGASSGYCRIQDKAYATHFTTGSVYSYRRAEHFLLSSHITAAGGGFSGNASSGCVLPITGVIRRYYYGDISFQNETIVLPLSSQGTLMLAGDTPISSTTSNHLRFPILPSKPFVPFTIDFDGMPLTSHNVDFIITKYLSRCFYNAKNLVSKIGNMQRLLPIGGLVLDCTGQTQRKVDGVVKVKYKHSCHVHFPSIVMSLDDLEMHTNAVRAFVKQEKLTEYVPLRSSNQHSQCNVVLTETAFLLLKPGDVVKHSDGDKEGSLHVCLLSSQWIALALEKSHHEKTKSSNISNRRELVEALDMQQSSVIIGEEMQPNESRDRADIQPKPEPARINIRHMLECLNVSSKYCDFPTLLSMYFVCESFQIAAGKEIISRTVPRSFVILRKIVVSKGDFKVNKIQWDTPSFAEAEAHKSANLCKEPENISRALLAAKLSYVEPVFEAQGKLSAEMLLENFTPFANSFGSLTLISSPADLESGVSTSEVPAPKRIELFKNIKEKILEKNPNTEHFWDKVIDTGLVVSKKLRMYLCDKYDQTYDQEFRPLHFDRFLPFPVENIDTLTKSIECAEPLAESFDESHVCDLSDDDLSMDYEEMFGFDLCAEYGRDSAYEHDAESHFSKEPSSLSSSHDRPRVSLSHDQILAMSSLQRPKIFDILGDQHFVDEYRKCNGNISEADAYKSGPRTIGFNPLQPSPRQLVSLGSLTECPASGPETILNATTPILDIPSGAKAKEAVTKYAGIYPMYWVCIHHKPSSSSTNVVATISLFIGGNPIFSRNLPVTEQSAEHTFIKALNHEMLRDHAFIFAPHARTPNLSTTLWKPNNLANNLDSSSVCVMSLHTESAGSLISSAPSAPPIVSSKAKGKQVASPRTEPFSICTHVIGGRWHSKFDQEAISSVSGRHANLIKKTALKPEDLRKKVQLEGEVLKNAPSLATIIEGLNAKNFNSNQLAEPRRESRGEHLKSNFERRALDAVVISLGGCDFASFESFFSDSCSDMLNLKDRSRHLWLQYSRIIVKPLLSIFTRMATAEGANPLDPLASRLRPTAGVHSNQFVETEIAVVCRTFETYDELLLWAGGDESGMSALSRPTSLSTPWRALFFNRSNKQRTHLFNFADRAIDHKYLQKRSFNIVIVVDPITTTDPRDIHRCEKEDHDFCMLLFKISSGMVVVPSDADATFFNQEKQSWFGQ